MSTKNRFRKYIEMEKMAAEKVRELADFGGEITRITPVEEGKTYDRVVVLEGGKEIKLEIQITEAQAWRRFHDVRLDLLSAFTRVSGSPFSGFLRIYPEECQAFLESVRVQRCGKLFQSEAETLAFYVTKPVDLLWLFSMPALQENREYFMSKYGIMINRKSRDEEWESCFVAVHSVDPILDKIGVKYEMGEYDAGEGPRGVLGRNDQIEPKEGELF